MPRILLPEAASTVAPTMQPASLQILSVQGCSIARRAHLSQTAESAGLTGRVSLWIEGITYCTSMVITPHPDEMSLQRAVEQDILPTGEQDIMYITQMQCYQRSVPAPGSAASATEMLLHWPRRSFDCPATMPVLQGISALKHASAVAAKTVRFTIFSVCSAVNSHI